MAITSSTLTGRTTNALNTQKLLTNVGRDQAAIARIQQQISSGQRLLLPSDDPVAAIQIFALNTALARQAEYENNIKVNQGYLSVTDQALGTVAGALNRAKALAQTGIGTTVTDEERQNLALEAQGLLQSVVNAANAQYQGRYLFGGSYGASVPFASAGAGLVRYNGDGQSLQTYADAHLLLPNNLDGLSAFAGLTEPIVTRDLDPALTLPTKLADLRGGAGIDAGPIVVSVENGGPVITKTIDLTGAETLQDVKTRIESAFAAEAITVTVGIDPGTNSGLLLTPSAGTIAVQNGPASQAAMQLGIVSPAAADINGANLDPKMSLFTTVASLNGGTGIGATLGTGLRIVNGPRTSVVDLDGAATVQDVLNRIRAADPDLVAEISPDGRGLSISSRLSGADFSIGENGGLNATNLGIRTLNASTLLRDLNYGTGIALDQDPTLIITRRDGTTATVDLTGSATMQDVLDKINAVDPTILVATLNAVGNGISLADSSGAGVLAVADNELAMRLGIAGEENTGTLGVLVGSDKNPQQPPGTMSLLSQLYQALQSGDDIALNRLLPAIDAEVDRINGARGAVGARQQLLDAVTNRLGETQLTNQDSLSKLGEVDLAAAITELLQKQQTLQATLQVAAQVNQMSLLDYL